MNHSDSAKSASEQVESITLNPPGQDRVVATFAFDVPYRIVSIGTGGKKSPEGPDGLRVVGILNGHPDEKVELTKVLETLDQTVCTVNAADGPRQTRVVKVECDERSSYLNSEVAVKIRCNGMMCRCNRTYQGDHVRKKNFLHQFFHRCNHRPPSVSSKSDERG